MASEPRKTDLVPTGWLSEFDVAHHEGNWELYALSFSSAANVLAREYRKALITTNDSDWVASDCETQESLATIVAQFFCMAFALELAIKAALVSQGAMASAGPGDRLSFEGHNLRKLGQLVRDVHLSQPELDCLEVAGELILTGKYPVGLRPGNEPSQAVHAADYDVFEVPAKRLYECFIEIAANHS